MRFRCAARRCTPSKGTWAVFSDNQESLSSALADPAPAVADLTQKYLFAVRGSVQEIPAARREKALAGFRDLVALVGHATRLQGGEGDGGRKRQADL